MAKYEVDVGDSTYEVDAPDERTAWAWANMTHKGGAPKEKDKQTIGGNLKEFGKGLLPGGIGLLETAGVGASALLPEEEEKAARQFIQEKATAGKQAFAAAPGYEESVGRKLGEGLGSTLPFFALGPLRGVGTKIGTGLGLAAGAGEARQEAEAKGATEEERRRATLLGAPTGLLDTLAPEIAPFKNIIGNALARGGVEGATEAAQKIAQNLIAQGIYDPNRDVLAGSGEEGVYGAGVGALASLIIDMTLGRKSRSPTNIKPPAAPEAPAAPTAETPAGEEPPIAPNAPAAPPVTQAAPPAAPAAPTAPLDLGDYTTGLPTESEDVFARLQNRDRTTPASIQQMQDISKNPDYDRLKTSSDFGSGAPVVISDVKIPESQLGKTEVVTASDGRKIPVQYAVVNADDVTTSHTADGRANQTYADINTPAVRAVAGNGRIAGLQAAYGAKTAEDYRKNLLNDAQHGIDPKAAEQLANPVLVRLMPKGLVTPDIGDVSNVSGTLRLNPVETAANDSNRFDINGIQFKDDGSFDKDSLIQFVRAMPKEEQGELMDKNGMPNTKAIDRLNNAIFHKAYGSETLIDLYAQAADPEAKLILQAMARSASKAAQLEGAGEYDIRKNIVDAAELAVNARRNGIKLKDYVNQGDIGMDPNTRAVLDMFAENGRSGKRMGEYLSSLADAAAEQANAAPDMFGEKPKLSLEDIFAKLKQAPEAEKDLFTKPEEPVEEQKAFDVANKSDLQIERELTGLSMEQANQWMIDNAPNSVAKYMAQKIAARLKAMMDAGVPMEFRILPKTTRDAGGTSTASMVNGKYSVKVELNGANAKNRNGFPTSGSNYKTLMHEMFHAATQPQTWLMGDLARKGQIEQSALYKELSPLLTKIRSQITKDISDGKSHPFLDIHKRWTAAGKSNPQVKNVSELISYGLTEMVFQDYLKTVQVAKDQSAFSKLVDLFRKLLKMDTKYQSALEELASVTERGLEVPVSEIKAGTAPAGYIVGNQESIAEPSYANVPRGLMGFRKNGPQKGFAQEKYKHVQYVKVAFPDGTTFVDAIKGLNKPHALARAKLNWDGANVEAITQQEAEKIDPSIREDISISEESLPFFGKKDQPTPTGNGQASLANLASMGRGVAKPEDGYYEKVKQSWNNARDNPAATAEAARSTFQRWRDRIETWAFSSDAALNNAIRREVMASSAGQEEKIGLLLNASLSQTVHSDAVASLFLQRGGITYDDKLHKWVGVDSNSNFVTLSKQLDAIAEKNGLTKPQIELIAHAAFEAKRTKSLIKFNDELAAKIAAIQAEAAAKRVTSPVAASALSEKAQRMKEEFKYIHLDAKEIAAGMEFFKIHPELNEVVKTWNEIRDNAAKVMVESGLWSASDAEFLLSNADYVPFYREDQLEQGQGPKEFIRGLKVQAKERKLKGSDKPVNDIFDNQVRWVQYSINRAVRNRSAIALADTAVSVGAAKRAQNSKDGANVTRIWRDGKEEYYDMADPMFMEAFNGLEAVVIPSWKWASNLADTLRQSVVMYPLFSVAQVPQDSFAAMFSSGLKPQFALRIPILAVKEFIQTLRGKSRSHEELKNIGAVGVRDFTSAMVRQDAEIYAGLKAPPGLLGKLKYGLNHIAMAADNAVRQAVFEAAEAQGLSKAEAFEKSFEVFNVRRKGSSKSLALASQLIPFFNAYLAAQSVAYKTITGRGISPQDRINALQTLTATTASVMTLSLLYAMLNGDDDDYNKKPAVQRDRLLMIPGTGGMSIPLRSDLFTLPKIITEHMYLLMTDKGYEDGRKFRESITNALGNSLLGPTAVPQAIKPIVEVAINHDFFQGRPLIGTYQQKLDTERQFTDTTSEFGKFIGSSGLISPIAVDHLVRGMFGSAGGLTLYMTSAMLDSNPEAPRPSLSMQDAIAALPGMSGFVAKTYENSLKRDFYSLKEEVDKSVNTFNDLKKRSPEEIPEFIRQEENVRRLGLQKSVNKIAEDLSKIRDNISRITNANMPADEKQRQIEVMRQAEANLLKGVNVKRLREIGMI